MRFALTSDHKEFYSKQGTIEFEGLLSPEAIVKLQQEINKTLSSRLRIAPPQLDSQPSRVLFESGFDLWRANSEIKKTLFKPTLSEIAAQLFQTQLLRIGFDQYLSTSTLSDPPLNTSLSLNDLSCAHPLIGGLILLLSEPSSDPRPPLIPAKAGNGMFISPDKPIPWKELFSLPHLQMILVAYAPKQTFYRLQKCDPHTHRWKSLGYVFGDLLNDHLHPIIYR